MLPGQRREVFVFRFGPRDAHAGSTLDPDLSVGRVDGILLPVLLVFILLLVNDKHIMGKYKNGKIYNIISWALVAVVAVLTVMLLTIVR